MNDKPQVLLVEDDDWVREMTAEELARDFRVRACASGEDALLQAEAEPPDVILLDVEMAPGIDGYETCRRLKASDTLADIPVVFVSGHDALDNRLKGYEAGGEDYIVKPFAVPELAAKILRMTSLNGERVGLRHMFSAASSTAMTAMTSMSELGALLESIKRFGTCADYPAQAAAAIAGLALHGLRGTVQIRSVDGTVTRGADGDASPLEVSIIEHMTNMERITQFKSRLAITYPNFSLLVHDMPVADADRCGRLRDHLAMLAEGAEARIEAIAAAAELRRRGDTIGRAVAHITATLADIDRAQREQQVATRIAVESLTDGMHLAYASVAITTAQEDYLAETLQRGLHSLLDTQTGFSGLQDRLSSIVHELKQMNGAL